MVTSCGVSSPAGRQTPIDAGTGMVLVAGIALIAYGAFFVWRNFNGFIELGLTPQHVGGTPDEIRAFSPRLYNYISHLHIAVAGFIIAIGVAVVSLAWNGMRHHARWALRASGRTAGPSAA